MKKLLVFDMDGVLVDVSGSYRTTIIETVRHFTGKEVSRNLVQDYKNAGGWNNDWALSQKIVADVGGLDVPYEDVVNVFQRLFLGENNDGLILREEWIPRHQLLDELAGSHGLAIFTGRPLAEVDITLNRFVPHISWAFVAADDTVAKPKPAPDGLFDIAKAYPGADLLYFGDTVDDARSARAAGVRFVGVAHKANPKHAELQALLRAEGAVAIIDNVNEIEEVL